MKPHRLKQAFLLPVVLLSLSLVSCVDPVLGGGYRGSVSTYSTLPLGYSGSAYQYNGRYYSGGQYQTGNYNYQGRQYTNRYYHDGRYYYGGSHAHYQGDGHNHGSRSPQQHASPGRSHDRGSNYPGSSGLFNSPYQRSR